MPRWDCNKFFHGGCRNPDAYERFYFCSYGKPSALTTRTPPKFRYSKITLFTGQQPRHLALVHRLAEITDTLYVVHEVAGRVTDRQESDDAMDKYFSKVQEAEFKYFGRIRFTPTNARTISMLSGDASVVSFETYGAALEAALFVVFGAFLKGDLGTFLEEHRAVNCHMGLSLYYRGSAATFWAVDDGNYAHNGATIHHLTSKLDGGDIICHCVPNMYGVDNVFDFTMKTVKVTHDALISILSNGDIWRWKWQPQDASLKMRYCRKSDLTADVARNWLATQPTREDMAEKLNNSANPPALIRPFYG